MSDAVRVVLSCSNCGAKLEIPVDIDRFVCAQCGAQQIVRRGGGIVSLQPLVQGIERVQVGTDKTAAELAIARLTKEIIEAEAELFEIENIPPAQLLREPDPDVLIVLLVIVGAIATLIISGAMNATGLGLLLAVTGAVVAISYRRTVEDKKVEQWLGKVEAKRQSMFVPVLDRMAALDRKLRENRQIANS